DGLPAPASALSAPAAAPATAPAAAPATASSQLGLPEAPLTAAITLAYRPHPPVILPPPPPPAPPPPVGETALAAARTALGTPYVWGGTSKGGFDCSGLVQWAFRQAGVALPRTSQTQSAVGQPVSMADLRPGDLVFFYSEVSHVGIYVGDGQVLHAPRTGDVVKISPLARMPFHNARRI
ncbi:MAG: C40 family peptidase, partial [Pseudonocardia sp.]|nr:C40 family peptidase [Pseudonocardia sp.]